MTKPTLEEQIACMSDIVAFGNDMRLSILASLKELQSIRSAELPVEPEPMPEIWLAAHRLPAGFKLYTQKTIDALKSALQVAQQEHSDVRRYWRERAEKAESELAALRGRLMEPSEEMRRAGWNHRMNNPHEPWDETFKAMSARGAEGGEMKTYDANEEIKKERDGKQTPYHCPICGGTSMGSVDCSNPHCNGDAADYEMGIK